MCVLGNPTAFSIRKIRNRNRGKPRRWLLKTEIIQWNSNKRRKKASTEVGLGNRILGRRVRATTDEPTLRRQTDGALREEEWTALGCPRKVYR